MSSETFGPQAFTGVITVTTAGTAVNGSDVDTPNGVIVRALSTNTGVVYFGNDGAGDVASTNGFELSAGDQMIVMVGNLKDIWFDAATNGDKFCWLKA